MVSSGYEELEHTADIALRAWGEDFFALLRQSAKGMYELMGIELSLNIPKEVEFVIEENDRDIQLVDFLNEILYFVEEDKALYSSFNFTRDSQGILVEASGYKTHSIRRNIKAVTFHNLAVEETDLGLEVSITFDV